MIAEKTIKMNVVRDGEEKDVDVRLRYCIASETGFEVLSNKESSIFVPTPTGETDEQGNPVYDKPKATTEDYLRLAIACILAAYECKGEEPPVTVNDILYGSSPEEVTNLIAATVELRLKWYHISELVKPETNKKEDAGKNA